jgi:thiol-disulfide isomerase/thioredoxin
MPAPAGPPPSDPPRAAAPPRRFSFRDFFLGMAAGVVTTMVVLGLLVVGAAMMVSRMATEGESGVSAALPPPEFPAAGQRSIYGKADRSWTFRTLEGDPVTLADFEGKVVFLNFWATWCGPCVVEIPSIQKLRDALEKDAVAFVLVSDEDRDKIRSFIERKKWSLTSFRMDGDRPALFEAPGIPATFILDPQGVVVFQHIGMAQWDHESTVTFVRDLLAKKPVRGASD